MKRWGCLHWTNREKKFGILLGIDLLELCHSGGMPQKVSLAVFYSVQAQEASCSLSKSDFSTSRMAH